MNVKLSMPSLDALRRSQCGVIFAKLFERLGIAVFECEQSSFAAIRTLLTGRFWSDTPVLIQQPSLAIKAAHLDPIFKEGPTINYEPYAARLLTIGLISGNSNPRSSSAWGYVPTRADAEKFSYLSTNGPDLEFSRALPLGHSTGFNEERGPRSVESFQVSLTQLASRDSVDGERQNALEPLKMNVDFFRLILGIGEDRGIRHWGYLPTCGHQRHRRGLDTCAKANDVQHASPSSAFGASSAYPWEGRFHGQSNSP
jgi:hypothetical protein